MDTATKAARKKARGQIPQSTRFNVFRRDNFACRYCGRSSPDVTLHCDHAISVKNGGADSEDNLVTSCADCNFGKSSQTVIRPAPKAVAPVATPADAGLIGMWGHTYDDQKEIQYQFKVIRAAGLDIYICQLFSWLDGEPTNCIPISTAKLLSECTLYADNGQMLVAYEKHSEKKYAERRRAKGW